MKFTRTPKKGLDILLGTKMTIAEQPEIVQDILSKDNGKPDAAMAEQGLVTPEERAQALSLELNIPLVDLKRQPVEPAALRLVPEKIARKHTLIPLDILGDRLIVVMANPENIQAIQDISMQTKMTIEPAVGVPEHIREAIDLNYRVSGEIQKQVGQMAPAQETAEATVVSTSAETPIARTVDLLIAQAAKDRASDIHIEPEEDLLRIRYRIDGILHDAVSLPLSVHNQMVSRLKIMAEMNIAERRRPQDGQISVKLGGKDIDIRVATAETVHGEMMVLRILDKSLSVFPLSQLGFLPESLEKYRRMLKSPFGMVLVSGPTGSGKTTTLYASVNQLDFGENNIITIEDPVEYRFTGINQMQVNPRAGITFASGLRASMRLDPDIILVGEIRDADTARTAVQAALTGHLVLSSVHANDTVGVLFRLIDLGVEPYLISTALVGVVAQRMVRRVCPHCRVLLQASPEEQAAYEQEMGERWTNFYYGTGCNFCANTGFLGRTGVFETLIISEQIRRMLTTGAVGDDIRAQAVKEGLVSMKRDGMLKARDGITTPGEVMRHVFSVT